MLDCGQCLDGQACADHHCAPRSGTGATRWQQAGPRYHGVAADRDGTLLTLVDQKSFARLDSGGNQLWIRAADEILTLVVPATSSQFDLSAFEDRTYGTGLIFRYSWSGLNRTQIGATGTELGVWVVQVDPGSGRYLVVVAGGTSIFKLTLRDAGDRDLWSLNHDWSIGDGISAAFDPQGNVLIASKYDGPFSLLGVSGGTAGQSALVTAKLSPQGKVTWVREYPCDSRLRVDGVGATALGTMVVVGEHPGALEMGDLQVGGGAASGFLAAIEASGQPRWLLDTGIVETRLAVDPIGKAAVAGRPRGGSRVRVVEYNLAGALLWTRDLGGASCSSLSSNGLTYLLHQVVLSGDFQGACDFGLGPPASTVGGYLLNLGE